MKTKSDKITDSSNFNNETIAKAYDENGNEHTLGDWNDCPRTITLKGSFTWLWHNFKRHKPRIKSAKIKRSKQ